MLNPEITEARRGNITASGAHAIMAGWDAPRPSSDFPAEIYGWIEKSGRKPLVGELKSEVDCEVSSKLIEAAWKAYQFGQPKQGLLTYAEQLACDELFNPDPMLYDGSNNPHMINGNERELEAMRRLSDATGINFVKTGDDQIHISVDGIGATPDGIAYDDLDLISDGAEVKCRSPLHHARQLLIHDNATLIEHDFERYCQVQVGCLVAGTDKWYSANFNPFAILDSHKFNYCVIERDESFLKVFKERADMVFKHKQMFMDRLNGIVELRNAA